MIHDGIQFAADKSIVRIGLDGAYVKFGKVCSATRKGAVRTDIKRDGEILYAIPIVSDRYSKTNMMYGPNGIIYLMLNGRCYKSKNNRSRRDTYLSGNANLSHPPAVEG